jgi:hypothetical protein
MSKKSQKILPFGLANFSSYVLLLNLALGCGVFDSGGGSNKTANGDASQKIGGKFTPQAATGGASLAGYWVWEKRVEGSAEQKGDVDKGQMKIALGGENHKCHYVWNETTGSDFHTECTYAIDGDTLTWTASKGAGVATAGYSCAHPGWTSWNDRPATQFSRFKMDGDRLWVGVNTYWGFGGGVNNVPQNGSLKRFPFWESKGQATTLESWIVFKRVTKAEWFSTYAISTNCQGSAAACETLKGCGSGEKSYVD